MIKILHLSRTILAGAPYRLHSLINKYRSDKYISRCATGATTGIKFPVDIQVPFKRSGKNFEILDSDELISFIEWADIIHIHNYPPIPPKSSAWDKMKGKKIILQLHSPPLVSERAYNNLVEDKKVKIDRILVIAQYHAVFIKVRNMVPVRNIIDINDELLQPLIVPNEPIIISYAPSNTIEKSKIDSWAYKSAMEVEELFSKLKGKIRPMFHTNKPWKQSLKERKRANIHIDEVSTGSYHLSSLEGLSQAKVVIANIAPWMENVIKRVTGCTEIPWYKANEENLYDRVVELVNNKDKILELQRKSREWMNRYWNPDVILKDYERFYLE